MGEGFHTNDPRIGLGVARATLIASSRAYQIAATENALGTQFRLALARVSNSQALGKIDADTGLQEDLGPSLIRSLTFSARKQFSFASLQATIARASARELPTMADVPEAPRAIYDFSATGVRLPWKLRASGGLEYVGRKPLGGGFNSVPVKEIRGGLTRTFANDIDASARFFAGTGYTGQTLETLQLPDENVAAERIVGVRQTSYISLSLSYHFRRR